MNSVDAAFPIAVTLTAAQWNQILGLCGEGTWRIADPLIKEISRQIFAAAAAAARPEPAIMGNGAEGAHVSD